MKPATRRERTLACHKAVHYGYPIVSPPVSIFAFVRNGARSVRRAVDSIVAQSNPNIEFVVQDGASTDGTLEILKSYRDRIKLRSGPDHSPTEAFWRSLPRCAGNIVGSCLVDEGLLPNAVERAVWAFEADETIGAMTGDALITDIHGNITGSWTNGPSNWSTT